MRQKMKKKGKKSRSRDTHPKLLSPILPNLAEPISNCRAECWQFLDLFVVTEMTD